MSLRQLGSCTIKKKKKYAALKSGKILEKQEQTHVNKIWAMISPWESLRAIQNHKQVTILYGRVVNIKEAI